LAPFASEREHRKYARPRKGCQSLPANLSTRAAVSNFSRGGRVEFRQETTPWHPPAGAVTLRSRWLFQPDSTSTKEKEKFMRKRNTQRTSSSRRPIARSSHARRESRGQRSEYESHSQENELHELFLEELADIYNAEQQLTKALPKMAKAAQNEELREGFEMHLNQTEQQISRLEQVVETLGESMKRKVCKGMKGLIEEGSEMMQEHKGSAALDAALIAAAQKVEHYEIAAYGTLCAWAKQMNHSEALELLHETLDEEKMTDEKLTQLAEDLANLEAGQG
jgi:ferritin-like metal-binding protein YciE